MLNKKGFFGILVTVLLLTVAVYGYTDDARLNGTWVFEDSILKEMANSSFKEMFISMLKQMSGGLFSPDEMKVLEYLLNEMSDLEVKQLIEESIEESKLILKDSELKLNNGNAENTMSGKLATRGTFTANNGKMTTTITHYNGEVLGLDSRMYSRKELLDKFNAELGVEMPIPESETVDYTVNGSRLTLTNEYSTTTYTRK